MTAPRAVAALLGGTLTEQARRLGLHRVQWSRYVAGVTVPLATAFEGWSAALMAGEGVRLALHFDGSGWVAELAP